MELKQILGVFFLLLAGVFYYKNKAEQKAAEAELAKLFGRDEELKKKEDAVKSEIKAVEQQDDSKLSSEERAKRWEK